MKQTAVAVEDESFELSDEDITTYAAPYENETPATEVPNTEVPETEAPAIDVPTTEIPVDDP